MDAAGDLQDADLAPRRKKPRTNVACEACKRRKSRCDIITGPRCHRCEQLGSECSFEEEMASASTNALQDRGNARPSYNASARTDEVIGNPYNEIRELHDRIRKLEATQNQMSEPHLAESKGPMSKPTSSTNDRYHVGDNSQDDQPTPASELVRDEAWHRAAAAPEDFSLIYGGLRGMREVGLRDPVAEGIVPEAQADVAYQMFKHHMTAVLPYRPLLSIRSRLPTHPFLRSACLLYASRCVPPDTLFNAQQLRNLESNVGQNILAYQFGCRASLESILASLILSFLPYGNLPGPPKAAEIDAARMAGLAWGQLREFGSTIFFERTVDLLESDVPLEYISEALDNARLHFCVLTRVCWTNLSRCPSNDVPTALSTIHHRFLELLRIRGIFSELDRHLMFEHRALDICIAQAQAMRKLERVRTPAAMELRSGNDGTREATHQIEELRRRAASELCMCFHNDFSLPSLLCQISYLRWWIGIRNLWFGYRIPTPLIVDSLHYEWLESVALAGQASAGVITNCLKEEWDLKGLPKAIGNAVILCYHTLSMGLTHLAHYHPEIPLPAWLPRHDELDAIRNFLDATNCPSLQHMLAKVQTTLDDHKRQLKLKAKAVSAAATGDVQTSSFVINFPYNSYNGEGLSLDSLMASYNTDPMVTGQWDAFMELGHGWDLQQPPLMPDGFWAKQ